MFKFLRRFLKDPEASEQVRLQEKFTYFRRLLDNNNQALETMADMEEKLSGDYVFDSSYISSQVHSLGEQVSGMVAALNLLTNNRYQTDLVPICQRLQEEMLAELEAVPTIPDTPFILPLSALHRELAPAVGGKMANLGEIGNRVGLPVPQGFAITAAAYKRFLESSSLAADLEARLSQANIEDLDSLRVISQELQAMVRQAPLPRDLEDAIAQAGQYLPTDWLAVRSSAVGEDTEFSFAGQFATLLNVDAASLPGHYKEIVASKFTSRAIFYWKYQQFSVNALPMAVGVLAMVPARASGVMFSLDPHAPQDDTVVISAVWGLGQYAVDGTVSPDLFTVSRQDPHPIIQRRVAEKPVALACGPAGGVEEITLTPEQAQAPCLTDDQVRTLAEIALELEDHFGQPQDIEWTVGEAGNLIILQSRPLRISAPAFAEEERPPVPEPMVAPILTYGIRAVGGVAAGRVHHFLHDADVSRIPAGAVVVSRQPSARLVLVMDRIAAIITEVGSPTGHMSILAREFRIPTLVEVGGATKVLTPGQLVTVDADAALVYPGVMHELLARNVKPDEVWRSDPVFLKLRRILKSVSRLNLLDPGSPEFTGRQLPHPPRHHPVLPRKGHGRHVYAGHGKGPGFPPGQPPQDRPALEPVHPGPGGRPQGHRPGSGDRGRHHEPPLQGPAPGLSPPRGDLGRPGGPGPQGLHLGLCQHHVRHRQGRARPGRQELRHRHRVLPQFQLPHRLPFRHRRRLHLRGEKRQLHQLPVQGRGRPNRPPGAPGPPGQAAPGRPGF